MATSQQTGNPRNGKECNPDNPNPPRQPEPSEDCGAWTNPKKPECEKPDACKDVEKPDCKCPKDPTADPDCFQQLIEQQAATISAAEKAKTFKTELEAFVTKAKAARQDYTRDKYKSLLAEWEKQDDDICDLLHALTCAVPCWSCILECHVCPMLNELHNVERWLYGDGTWCTPADGECNLYDLRYWLERDLDMKKRRFDRLKLVLAAWEKPAQTIEKALADDAKLIADCNKALRSEPGKVVYDVFMRLVPMHLAIAPPKDVSQSCIDNKYTEICKCDAGTPHVCCGIDIGDWGLRQRLVGAQPYLIDPGDYMDKVVCCLVKNSYGTAKEDYAAAEAEFQRVDEQIKRLKTQVDDGLKNFEKNAKGMIPSVFDCCDDYDVETETTSTSAR